MTTALDLPLHNLGFYRPSRHSRALSAARSGVETTAELDALAAYYNDKLADRGDRFEVARVALEGTYETLLRFSAEWPGTVPFSKVEPTVRDGLKVARITLDAPPSVGRLWWKNAPNGSRWTQGVFGLATAASIVAHPQAFGVAPLTDRKRDEFGAHHARARSAIQLAGSSDRGQRYEGSEAATALSKALRSIANIVPAVSDALLFEPFVMAPSATDDKPAGKPKAAPESPTVPAPRTLPRRPRSKG